MDKYQKAWEKFQIKMSSLRKRQTEIFSNIYKKMDQKKIEIIRKKLQNK